jgi:hypothetical protein
MIPGRLTNDDLIHWLNSPLADAIGIPNGKFEISLLSPGDKVADGTTVFLLRNLSDQPLAVVLCSPAVSPGMVKRAMDRAQQAKVSLSNSAGKHILDPLAQGWVKGLSCAILPYCLRLSDTRFWWIQRALLRQSVFDWLRQLTECTVSEANSASIEHKFVAPLRHMVWLTPIRGSLRTAASRAIERLNVRNLSREVNRHCHLLGCERVDATSYLIAALGHIAMNLEHFPMENYTNMAESCYATLDHALATY